MNVQVGNYVFRHGSKRPPRGDPVQGATSEKSQRVTPRQRRQPGRVGSGMLGDREKGQSRVREGASGRK